MQPNSRNTVTVTFSMPPETAQNLQQVAGEEQRTVSELLREAIRLYMEERVRQEARRLRVSVRNPARSEPVAGGAGMGTRGRTVSEASPTMWRRSPYMTVRC